MGIMQAAGAGIRLPTPAVSNKSYSAFNIDSISSTATVTFSSNGQLAGYTYSSDTDNFFNEAGQWLTFNSTVAAAGYEIFATYTGSTLTIDAGLNGWLGLSTSRTWGLQVNGGAGARSGTLSITIRKIGTTTPTYSCSINLAVTSIA